MSAINPDVAEMNIEAKEAVQVEKAMTFAQAIKLYPKAVGWSILLSTAIVMEGYDTALLGNFYAFPPFTKRYGVLTPGSNPPSYQVRQTQSLVSDRIITCVDSRDLAEWSVKRCPNR